MISTARIRGILVNPRAEWALIEAEPTTPAALYAGWIAPLAAIGPIAGFIGLSFVGVTLPFAGHYTMPVGAGLVHAIVRYAAALAGVYVLALVIDLLAPNFGGRSDRVAALKVAAYSCTPAWLTGIFGLVPALAILGVIGGLYGFYLLYLGLPVLMKSPRERAVGYTLVVVLGAIVLFVLIGVLSSIVLRLAGGYPPGLPGGVPR